jgi:hypothetical protein
MDDGAGAAHHPTIWKVLQRNGGLPGSIEDATVPATPRP